jgi:uncharacterized delta-60 repeat protein
MRHQQPFTALALQKDGRIVLAAPVGEVVRLLPDGRPDGNFGVRGKKAAGASSSWYPATLAVARNGGIYVGGMSGYPSDTGEHWYGWLYRIAPSGLSGDRVGGFTGGESDEPKTFLNDVVLGKGGEVFGAGSIAERHLDAKSHAVLARLLPAQMSPFGTPEGPDPSFGGGAGLVTSNFFPASIRPEATNALRWDNGKLLIAGYANSDMLVSRYFRNGIQDNGFGHLGLRRVSLGAGSTDVANAVAVDARGGILAAGSSTHNCGGYECTSLLLARLSKDGNIVHSFGHRGIVRPPIGSGASGQPAFETAYEVAARPQGKILVGGLVGGPSGSRFFLRRYLADGTPDNSFGKRGRVTTLPVGVVGVHGVS